MSAGHKQYLVDCRINIATSLFAKVILCNKLYLLDFSYLLDSATGLTMVKYDR